MSFSQTAEGRYRCGSKKREEGTFLSISTSLRIYPPFLLRQIFFAPSFLPLPPIFLREGKGGREGLSKTSPRPVKSNGRRTYKGEEERGKGPEAPLTLREKGKKGALDTKDFFWGEGRGLSDRRRLLILIQPAESRRREERKEREVSHILDFLASFHLTFFDAAEEEEGRGDGGWRRSREI